MIRVTGGSLRGRRLATVRGTDVRPTSDLVRSAVFDLLGQDLSGDRVLDLFAGNGSLGIEALSRGAAEAVFIENSARAIEVLQRNLKLCGMEHSGVVLKLDLSRGMGLHGHPALAGPFDLVFLDPPYGQGQVAPLIQEIVRRGFLNPLSRVVAQSEKKGDLPARVGTLTAVKVRTYGATRITVFQNEEDS